MKCPHCNKEVGEQDFIEVNNFRIYKWSEPIKDFKIPKGWRLAEEREFIDAYDNSLIKLEKYPVIYFTKNRSEKNIKNGWGLSGLYLSSYLNLISNNDILANSDDDGRVVLKQAREKEILEMIDKLDFSDVAEYSDASYLINELKSKLTGENLK